MSKQTINDSTDLRNIVEGLEIPKMFLSGLISAWYSAGKPSSAAWVKTHVKEEIFPEFKGIMPEAMLEACGLLKADEAKAEPEAKDEAKAEPEARDEATGDEAKPDVLSMSVMDILSTPISELLEMEGSDELIAMAMEGISNAGVKPEATAEPEVKAEAEEKAEPEATAEPEAKPEQKAEPEAKPEQKAKPVTKPKAKAKARRGIKAKT